MVPVLGSQMFCSEILLNEDPGEAWIAAGVFPVLGPGVPCH